MLGSRKDAMLHSLPILYVHCSTVVFQTEAMSTEQLTAELGTDVKISQSPVLLCSSPPPEFVGLQQQNKLRGFSPHANYTDRAPATCRRS
jgi:hypothetical protein